MSVEKNACGLYRAGHLMHWVQMKKSHEGDEPTVPVKIAAVHDDGRVDIEGGNVNLTLWFHQPDRIRSAVGQHGLWKPKYHVLDLNSYGSFNMAEPDDERGHCKPPIRRRPKETVRQYIERGMRDYGGYTVPQKWLENLDAIPEGETGEPQSGYLVPVADNQRTPVEQVMLDRLNSLTSCCRDSTRLPLVINCR